MADKSPLYDPKNDWENIRKWIEKDDAKRNQMMRIAVREELKCVTPFMKKVGRLEVVTLILAAFDVGIIIYLIAQS